MNQNQAASFIAAQTALFNCRWNAMVAENQWQVKLYECPIFIMQDFKNLQMEFEPILGYNAIYQLYQDCER